MIFDESIFNQETFFQELKNEVYDQWLCTDLRESSTNYLPDDISTLAKYYTSGSLALQVRHLFLRAVFHLNRFASKRNVFYCVSI